MKKQFELLISYRQIIVFDPAMTAPFNDWTDQHVRQGFSWRLETVSFRTLPEQEATIDVTVSLRTSIKERADAVRAICVPFTVSRAGVVAIASVGTEDNLAELPPGEYALLFQAGGQWCDFVFMAQEGAKPAILRADGEITTGDDLLMEAEPAY